MDEKWGKREGTIDRESVFTYIINLREAEVVCLNYAQPADVNYAQTYHTQSGRRKAAATYGCAWRHTAAATSMRRCALEGLGDGLTRNLDCGPRVWEG